MKRTLAVLSVALVAVLGACSAPDAGPAVASLPTAASGSTSSGSGSSGTPAGTTTPSTSADATPGGGAPAGDTTQAQRRLDDSPEREAALWNTYNQCLLDHGAQRNDGREAGAAPVPGSPGGILILQPVPAEAEAACAPLFPLMPPELDPAKNPAYRDDFVAWITCMQKGGVPVHLTTDSGDPTLPSWTYDDGANVPKDSAQIEHDCQLKAFGGDQ